MTYYPVDIGQAIRKECSRRNYSKKTAKIYVNCVERFLNWTGKTIDVVSKKDVSEYLFHLSERGRSGSTLNVYHMAIRFLFEDILRKNIKLNVRYSKVPLKLPEVLTKEEVKALIGAITNEKHKLMVELMYSAGLRVSEMLNLKVEDINFDNNYGFVRQGKGNKDRIFVLSDKLKPKLMKLIGDNGREKEELIFISNLGKKYTTRSIQKIIDKATFNAGIEKNVHPHTLRHSFATHLIENGYSVNEVQALLGHKSPETTMIYVHLATPNMIKIKSPIDSL